MAGRVNFETHLVGVCAKQALHEGNDVELACRHISAGERRGDRLKPFKEKAHRPNISGDLSCGVRARVTIGGIGFEQLE